MRKINLKRLMVAFSLFMFVGLVGCNTEDVDFDGPNVEVSEDEINIPYTGGDQTFDVIAHRNWTIEPTDEAAASWLSITPPQGNGKQTITLRALSNPAGERRCTLKVATSIDYEYVYVIQQAAPGYESYLIYTESVGTLSVANPWPDVTAYAGWQRGGLEQQKDVTYAGTNATVRNSGGSAGKYPEASGGNNIFLGAATNMFEIQNIYISGYTNFEFSFGIYHYYDNIKYPITNETIDLLASIDGTNWTALEFTNKADADWVYATTNFSTPAGANTLYIRFYDAPASAIRLDDFQLIAGGVGGPIIGELPTEPVVSTSAVIQTNITATTAIVGGAYSGPDGTTFSEVGVEYRTESGSFVKEAATDVATPFRVTLDNLTPLTKYYFRAYGVSGGTTYYGDEADFTTKDASAVAGLYEENFGTKVEKIGSNWPYVDEFDGWQKGGTLDQSGVEYVGSSASIRNSGAAYDQEGVVTGAPYGFFGTGTQYFQINNINITGNDNFTLSFYISLESGYVSGSGPEFNTAISAGTVKLEGSIDGENWQQLSFTPVGTNPAQWVKLSAEFKTAAGFDKLYLKISEPSVESKIRFDDILLASGGNGTIVIGEGVTPQSRVTTGTATVTDNSVTIAGSTYTLGEGASNPTAVGVEYKTGDGSYTKVAASAVATPFSVTISSLTPAVYTYRAYATIDGADVVGNESTFRISDGTTDELSVAELRALGQGNITEELYMVATVISDNVGDNSTSKKNIVVSDGESGIQVRFADDVSYTAGTQLRFALQGASIAEYSGMLQLTTGSTGFPVSNVTEIGTQTIQPKAITAAQLMTGDYESMLVSVANVQVVNEDLDKTMVVGNANTTIKMEAQTGEAFVMFIAKAATFGSEQVPQGSGTITGIAGFSGGNYQVNPRNKADFENMTGARFGAQLELAFGIPSLTGALQVGTAASGTITIPYTNAQGTESYNVSVAVAGAGAAGITVEGQASPVTKNLTAGNGNITLAVTGNPTTAGAVTFTISGIDGLTATTVNGTVNPAGTGGGYDNGVLASWAFTDDEIIGQEGTGNNAKNIYAPLPKNNTGAADMVTGNATITLGGWEGGVPTVYYTPSNNSLYLDTWSISKYWLFTIPLDKEIAAGKVINLNYLGYGSNTGPKNFVIEVSTDNSNWSQVNTTIYANSNSLRHNIDYIVPATITSANLYFRVRPLDNERISGSGDFAAGGTSRMGSPTFTIKD